MNDFKNEPAARDEDDVVWALLEHATSPQPAPRFVDDVVRACRIETGARKSWWQHWVSPVPAVSFAAAMVAIFGGLFVLRPAQDVVAVGWVDQAVDEAGFAHLQEVLETEMLIAAVERLDELSDEDLAVLIGF